MKMVSLVGTSIFIWGFDEYSACFEGKVNEDLIQRRAYLGAKPPHHYNDGARRTDSLLRTGP
jgi:hypothetical protein